MFYTAASVQIKIRSIFLICAHMVETQGWDLQLNQELNSQVCAVDMSW